MSQKWSFSPSPAALVFGTVRPDARGLTLLYASKHGLDRLTIMMTRDQKLQIIGLLLGVVATVYTGYRTFQGRPSAVSPTLNREIDDLRFRAEQMAREIQRMSKAQDVAKGAIGKPKLAMTLARIEAGQADLQQRMKALEDSLIATPATSLALPLLRKDLDTLRERMQANELDSKQREQQSTDTMKWIFGLVAALITGVVAQWFGSRFKKT